MSTRRDFLKQSGLLASSLAIPAFMSSCQSGPKRYDYKPGLQLYTVRDAMSKDPKGSLAKVAEIGYVLMESATYSGSELFYGMQPDEFSAVLKQNGLEIPSGHYALGDPQTKGTILSDWEKAVADAHKVGMKYMVCAYLPEERRQTLDDYKQRAADFNKAGEICKQAGIQFCYHNHNFEFAAIDGQIPYDILLAEADKDLVKMEMDIYWVTRSGNDPLALMDKHPGRFVLWHVKDMANTSDKSFTEVGNGVIDWPAIFAKAQESGMQHFFVEQDRCPGDPFDSIRQSIDYLKKNILKA